MTKLRCLCVAGALAVGSAPRSSFGGIIDRDDFSGAAVKINFDVFANNTPVPSHTLINSQYAEEGVLFSGSVMDPEANDTHQAFYGPLASAPNVLLGGSSYAGSRILLTFVDPVSGEPAPTSAVGADIIFRDTGEVVTLDVFDENGLSLGLTVTPPDTGIGDEMFLGFGEPVIFSAEFVFDTSDSIVGIDNLIFEPVPEPATLFLLGLGGLTALRRRT